MQRFVIKQINNLIFNMKNICASYKKSNTCQKKREFIMQNCFFLLKLYLLPEFISSN